jgi:iron-sulfur cluster repair protein YtfE (RIC family)
MLRHAGLAPLSRQHHHGLALCVFTRRTLAADRSPEQLSRVAERIVQTYDLELANHFQLEEQLVFPLLDCRPVALVEQEHRELEALVERLRLSPDYGAIVEFISLLESHIHLEEREWFEELQRSVDDDTLMALGSTLKSRVSPTEIKQ